MNQPKQNKLKTFLLAVAAGFTIGLGCCIYEAAENKVVGAVLFTLGLFAVCNFGLNLYTGKIGYVFSSRNNPNIFVIYAGNLVGAVGTGLLFRVARPDLAEKAIHLAEKKLSAGAVEALILGALCGTVMYIAVDNHKHNKDGFGRYLGMLIGVPLFILAGFEHSIADMFYLAMGTTKWEQFLPAVGFIALVTVGNMIGAVTVHYLFGAINIKDKE